MSGVPQRLALGPALSSIFVSDTGNGSECTLSKSAGNTNLHDVVNKKDAIHRYKQTRKVGPCEAHEIHQDKEHDPVHKSERSQT